MFDSDIFIPKFGYLFNELDYAGLELFLSGFEGLGLRLTGYDWGLEFFWFFI